MSLQAMARNGDERWTLFGAKWAAKGRGEAGGQPYQRTVLAMKMPPVRSKRPFMPRASSADEQM